MLSNLLDDVQHWRNRAEQARVLAEQMNSLAREMMHRIASNYDRIAEQASVPIPRFAHPCGNL
jgi:hypothetical protein